MLQATGEFYREEGNRCVSQMDCIQYMKKVRSSRLDDRVSTTNAFPLVQILVLIDDEEFRSRKFLSPTSYKKVYNECLQRLVCDHFDTLKSECPNLIVGEDLEGEKRRATTWRDEIHRVRSALHNMYKLLNPTQIGTGYMVDRLQEHIAQIGHEKVQSLKGENVRRAVRKAKKAFPLRLFLVIDAVRWDAVGIAHKIHEYHQRNLCQWFEFCFGIGQSVYDYCEYEIGQSSLCQSTRIGSFRLHRLSPLFDLI